MHSVTGGQTDGRHDDANGRSYCVVMRSANNNKLVLMFLALFYVAFHTTSQSSTVDEVLPSAGTARNYTAQSAHEYSMLQIEAATETVAMEMPRNTTHKLTHHHSTTADVDFITVVDDPFTTGLLF